MLSEHETVAVAPCSLFPLIRVYGSNDQLTIEGRCRCGSKIDFTANGGGWGLSEGEVMILICLLFRNGERTSSHSGELRLKFFLVHSLSAGVAAPFPRFQPGRSKVMQLEGRFFFSVAADWPASRHAAHAPTEACFSQPHLKHVRHAEIYLINFRKWNNYYLTEVTISTYL